MNKPSLCTILSVLLILSALFLTACGDMATAIPQPAATIAAKPTFAELVATTVAAEGGGGTFSTTSNCLPALPATGMVVQACLSNTEPVQDTDVVLYARFVVDGKAITGAKMDANWKFKFIPFNCKSETDSVSGIATCTKNIENATKGFKVDIDVKFTHQSKLYSTTTSFTTSSAPAGSKAVKATVTSTLAPAIATTAASQTTVIQPAAATTEAATSTVAPATATAEPTATVIPPTNTSAPTATPIPATATSLPATATPRAAPTATPKPAAPAKVITDASSPCYQGQIKGNRNSMIYHPPSGRDYAKTKNNVQCFDTAAEAEAAGYRASKV